MDTLSIILAVLGAIALFWIGYEIGKKITDLHWHSALPHIRSESIQHSRSVIGGQVSEQLAPFLPEFPYKASEARFIGKPIDFIVLEGMDDGNIRRIIFVEVKTGKSKLSGIQQSLRECIQKGNIEFFQYNQPNKER